MSDDPATLGCIGCLAILAFCIVVWAVLLFVGVNLATDLIDAIRDSSR